MKWLALTALLLAGCGDDNLAGVGQPCSSSGECAQGLLCDFGRKPHVCEPQETVKGEDLSVPPDLAGDDLAGEDLTRGRD